MFKTVLVPVDVSIPDDTQTILSSAKTLTAPWACALHVVTVVPDMGMAIVGSYFDKGFEKESRDRAMQELQQAAGTAGIDAELHVLSGTIYDRVLALAGKISADLIVLRAHSPQLGDYLLGSNAARVVRHASQSVMVLRN